MKKVFLFMFLWVCWGFSLGTLLLLGPVRWAVDFGRTHAWKDNTEKTTVYVFIAVLIIVSFLFSWFSQKKLSQPNTSRYLKASLIWIPVFAIGVSIFAFMNPALINTAISKSDEKIGGKFAVGPYPELVKMYQLKGEGYTAVISLLHPAVVPFEPKLLDEEKKNAGEAGLQFINIPLLPWISDNKEAIDSLRRLVRNAHGKYYVHCYLGKDRTSAASRVIKQETSAVIDLGLKKKKDGLLDVTFERGPVIKLENDVYLAPLPTKEEYFDVVVDFQQVVSLSINDADAKKRNSEEQKWLAPYNIPFKAYEVNSVTSKEKMEAIVNEVKGMPRPLFIHGYFPNDPEYVLFKKLYEAPLK